MDALAKSVSMALSPQSSRKGRGLGEALPPGDSQTLTIPGILESLPAVNRSKFTGREVIMG
jgi:hypothetical protein